MIKSRKTNYISASLTGRHVVGLGDSSIDVFLVANLNTQGHLSKTYFPTSWLSDEPGHCEVNLHNGHPAPSPSLLPDRQPRSST
jgi:hypothetical protein